MLDILVALVEELFGTKKAPPPAQPRRRVRQPGQSSPTGTTRQEQPAVDNRPDYGNPWLDHPTTPVGQTNPPEFDQMVRQFFGMEEETPVQEEAPRPAPPQRPEPAVYSRNMVEKAPVNVSSISDSIDNPLSGTFTVFASLDDSVAAPAVTVSRGEERPLREIVHGLRNNPDAAREAFLYAEIFGPPLADKY